MIHKFKITEKVDDLELLECQCGVKLWKYKDEGLCDAVKRNRLQPECREVK